MLSIRLTEQALQELDRAAVERGVSRSVLVRRRLTDPETAGAALEMIAEMDTQELAQVVSLAARSGSVQAMKLRDEQLRRGESSSSAADPLAELDELARRRSVAWLRWPIPKTSELDVFVRFCANVLTTEDGSPLEIEPFQREILTAFFEGVSETVVIIPKKNGKSSLLASGALFHLLSEPSAEIIIVAAARDQASIMLRRLHPPLAGARLGGHSVRRPAAPAARPGRAA
jgi:hypothetical protein